MEMNFPLVSLIFHFQGKPQQCAAPPAILASPNKNKSGCIENYDKNTNVTYTQQHHAACNFPLRARLRAPKFRTQTMNWIRCKLSFALLRASIMSIRGARLSRHHAASEAALGPIDLQLVEGQILLFYFLI